jgi:hypothetical protein
MSEGNSFAQRIVPDLSVQKLAAEHARQVKSNTGRSSTKVNTLLWQY